ncbi:putative TIR domain, P-loop containing nucleoside triphosphate hydrolase, partial [Tanacetum coccineum]
SHIRNVIVSFDYHNPTGGLKNLAKLNLTGCKKLFRALSDKKYVKPERVKALRIGGGTPKEPLFSLPMSLKYLYIGYCEFEYKNDLCVVFHAQSFFYLSLRGNLFESLPNNIDLKMLRVLNLNSCPNLKSIVCLPNTLENLYTHWCTSLEKITFQSACFSLKKFGYDGCFKLSEIQGLLKLVPIASLDESDLGNMKWIKEYEDHKVDLVGDVITKGRIWHTQMLYEYGIRSTYLQGIKDKSMMSFEYTTSSLFLSFHVPLFPEKRRVQGLNISVLYRSSGEDKDYWLLFAKISNRTKGLTWVYNPEVYCKPRDDEDVVWLSNWPIGNILDAGDEVNVSIFVEEGLLVSVYGASLEYTDDGEVEQEENFENNAIGEEEIGGDLSEFESGLVCVASHLFASSVPYRLRVMLCVGFVSLMASLLVKRVASSLSRVRTIASSSRFFNTKGYEFVQHDTKEECILKCDDILGSSAARGAVNDAFSPYVSPTENLSRLLNFADWRVKFIHGTSHHRWSVVEDDKALCIFRDMSEGFNQDVKELVPNKESMFRIDEKN